MLNTELLDLLNSRELWAFVGSGTSVDAGLPSWGTLSEWIINDLHPDARQRIRKDPQFVQALKLQKYPAALGRLCDLAGRAAAIRALCGCLEKQKVPGDLTMLVARWPFKGYVTSNYDSLLERALDSIGSRGWTSLGNREDDSRLVSNNARGVIWHIHGATAYPDKSNFVLTTDDYAAFYQPGNQVLEQFRSLLVQQRVLFIGFGFNDEDLRKTLHVVGLLCNPANPAFAFIPDSFSPKERNELFDKYNIASITYQKTAQDHRGLTNLLKIYESMVVARTYSFSRNVFRSPSHDPETTSLFLYNELVLRKQSPLEEKVITSLIQSRILSMMRFRGTLSLAELIGELVPKIVTLAPGDGPTEEGTHQVLDFALQDLVTSGLIFFDTVEETYSLSTDGKRNVESRSIDAVLLERRFDSALAARTNEVFPTGSADQLNRIQQASFSFLSDSIRKRGVGVAKSFFPSGQAVADFHVLALLSSLPLYMKQLGNADEALALVKVITGVLRQPSEVEAEFIGAALQAQFAMVLLDMTPNWWKTRISLISSMTFIIDANILIAFFAKGATGHELARLMVNTLHKLGATTICTSGLVDEISEHARWAHNEIGPNTALSAETMKVFLGSAGGLLTFLLKDLLEK